MTRWIVVLLCATLATCQTVKAVDTYAGALHGTVAGATVAASVEIQFDGTLAVGQTVKARARLTSDPGPYPVSRNWSRWYTASVQGKPFRADVDLPDLRGRLGVDWTTSNITVAAEGTAGIFAVNVPPQRLALAFSAPAPTNTAPQPEKTVAGPMLLSASSDGSKVHFKASGLERWPIKTGGKPCYALLYVNGKKVEWVAVGRSWAGMSNLFTPGKYYQPGVKRGDIARVKLVSTDGKQSTNELTIKL